MGENATRHTPKVIDEIPKKAIERPPCGSTKGIGKEPYYSL